MKKILLLLITVITLCIIFTGCSFAWSEEEEGLSIAGIEKVVDADGAVYMEIRYNNSDVVDRFPLPDGNGIVDTSYEFNETEQVTEVTLTYQNGKTALVKVPFGKDGKDGATISKVELEYDLNDVPFLVFYSASENNLWIEQGKVDISQMKGKDGRGIEKWDAFSDEIGAGVSITLTGEKQATKYYFTYFQKVSIELIGNDYVVTITDGNPLTGEQVFYLTRQPTWLTGTNMPSDDNDGIPGDFYFDTRRKVIYVKRVNDMGEAFWDEVANFRGSCAVTFDPDGGVIKGFDDQQDDDVWVFDGIPYGAYFLDEYAALPTPEKDGYTFLGWYRNFEKGEGEVAFNIYDKLWDDQTFYAKWQEN